MRRLDALERGQEELEAGLLMLAHEVGARLAEVSGDPGELREALPARDPQGQPGGPGKGTPDAVPAATDATQAVIGRPRRIDRLPLAWVSAELPGVR